MTRLRSLALAALGAAVALGTLGLFLGSCATSGVDGEPANLISLEEEWSLGERLARDLDGHLRLVDDPQAVGYVSQVGERIVAHTELANLPWHFYLVEDPAVNAFALPGGQVYVDTGLIGAADDVAELAGVLAHEIGHGVARHGAEQLCHAYGLKVVAGLVLDQNPSVYQEVLTRVTDHGSIARYSREDEREADALGVVYMSEAGYDPRGMSRIFQVLLADHRSRPDSVERFFASHPLNEDRIREVEGEISAKHLTGSVREDPGYQRLRTRF